MKRKILFLGFVLICFVWNFSHAFANENAMQGHIEKIKKEKTQNELFIGTEDKLEKNDVIKMSVLQVLDAEVAKVNDEFFAEVTADVEGNKGIIIPQGTLAHGFIKKTTKAKKFGKNGELILIFDTLITPDGREIPIKGQMTTKVNSFIQASEMIKTNAVYATAGAAAGGLLALSWFGIGGAVSSKGTTLAGGAALGSSIGLGMALCNQGQDVLISPGDEIIVKLETPLKLPVYKKNPFPQPEIIGNGLEIKINDIIYKKNLYGKTDTIKISLSLLNTTKYTFSIFDIAIVDNFNTRYYPNIFEDEELKNLIIKPNDELDLEIPFSVDDIKSKLWLVFYDKNTKEFISKISLNNAYKKISDKTIKQNNKLLEKKRNFYKEKTPFDSN